MVARYFQIGKRILAVAIAHVVPKIDSHEKYCVACIDVNPLASAVHNP